VDITGHNDVLVVPASQRDCVGVVWCGGGYLQPVVWLVVVHRGGASERDRLQISPLVIWAGERPKRAKQSRQAIKLAGGSRTALCWGTHSCPLLPPIGVTLQHERLKALFNQNGPTKVVKST
jgi:hypothetical protein